MKEFLIGLAALTLGILFIRYLYYLHKPRDPAEVEYEKELEIWTKHMKQLGYSDWQMEEYLKEYTTIEKLRAINKKMHRNLKGMK